MSFLAPYGLLLGLLAGPLLALYFLRLRRRKVKVPSLLLWHAVKRSERLASPFERFKRNLLLLLQLLILLALTLAFARPFLETEKAQYRSVVLVLDSSASMGASDAKPTRFAAAVDAARDVIDSLGPGDEVMLVDAGPRTQVAVPFTRDVAKVRQALGTLGVSEAQGSLRDGLQLAFSLAKSRPDVEVIVFSDGGGENLKTVPTGGAEVRYVMMGHRATNTGIIALDLRRSPVSELDWQLFVTTQNYGRSEVKAAVEVFLDGKLVGLRQEDLSTEAPVSMVFDLPSGASGTLRVALDAPGDLLDADNEAFAVVAPMSLRKVLLVGGDSLTARALSADPRVRLKATQPGNVTLELLRQQDAILFAGPVPSGVDGLNYMVLGPEHGGPVTFGDEANAPRILGWRRTHPTMRFVGWDGVTIARSTTVKDPGGLQTLVEADAGPLVLAGERGGGRVLQLTFDPYKSDLPLRVGWPVLLLNSVGWLTEKTGGTAGAQIIAAGTPVVRRVPDGTTTALASGPAGAVDVVVGEGVMRVSDTDEVGIYELRAGDSRSVVAANLLSQRESNIAPRGALGLQAGEVVTTASAVAAGRRELWRPLLLFALLVLCIEWLVWNRRRSA